MSDNEQIYETMPLEGVPMDRRIKLLAKRYAREDMSAEQVAAFAIVTEEETKLGMTSEEYKEDRNAIARIAATRGDMNVLEAIFEQEKPLGRGNAIEYDLGAKLEGEKYKRGPTALALAIKRDDVPMVKKMVEKYATVHAEDKSEEGQEYTPLMVAVEVGNKEVVDLILKAHKDQSKTHVVGNTDAKGRTVLHIAAFYGHTEIAKTITKYCEEEYIKAVGNVKLGELKDDNGNTPADLAKENGHGDTAKAVGPGGCCTVM